MSDNVHTHKYMILLFVYHMFDVSYLLSFPSCVVVFLLVLLLLLLLLLFMYHISFTYAAELSSPDERR